MKNEKKSLRQMVDENPIFFLHRTNKSGFGDCYLNNATPHSSFLFCSINSAQKVCRTTFNFIICSFYQLPMLLPILITLHVIFFLFFRLLIVSTTLWSVSFVSFFLCCLSSFIPTVELFQYFLDIFFTSDGVNVLMEANWIADVMEFQNIVDADWIL